MPLNTILMTDNAPLSLSTPLYGLIGRHLSHTFSPGYFAEKFAREDINARYIAIELPDIGDVMELIAQYPNLRGFNVTIPYKQQIIPYLDFIDPAAAEVGAVNVVKITRGGDAGVSLSGYNTDVAGFARSLVPLLETDRAAGRPHEAALVLGTGGASKAVIYALRQLGIAPQPVSRHASQGVLTYADLTPGVMAGHTLIVNTTPLGMYPETHRCPDIPYGLITPDFLCYDLIYNPVETLFLKKAAAQGARTSNGLEMLHLQADASWEIWQK